MNTGYRTRFYTATVLVALAVSFLAMACAGAATPQNVTIPVKLEEGKLSPETVRVGQGDTVTLQIEAATPGSIHLHGFDIEQETGPSGITDFLFVASAAGRFRISFHPQDSDSESHGPQHGEIFQSEVLKPGDTYTFQVTPELDGQTLQYHSHLHTEISGTISVSHDAPAIGRIGVEIQDMALDPVEVWVQPGTTIVWTNNSAELQALASGTHWSASEGEQDYMHTEAGPPESGHDHNNGQEEEIDVGFLEVMPR